MKLFCCEKIIENVNSFLFLSIMVELKPVDFNVKFLREIEMFYCLIVVKYVFKARVINFSSKFFL